MRAYLTDTHVALHQFAVSAATAVDPALGSEQTQILAAAIVGVTWGELTCTPPRVKISLNHAQLLLSYSYLNSCLRKRTAVGVLGHGDDAHGLLGDVGTQHFHIPAEFIRSEHSSAYPICPEDVLAVYSQAKRVHGLVLQDHLHIYRFVQSVWLVLFLYMIHRT